MFSKVHFGQDSKSRVCDIQQTLKNYDKILGPISSWTLNLL